MYNSKTEYRGMGHSSEGVYRECLTVKINQTHGLGKKCWKQKNK